MLDLNEDVCCTDDNGGDEVCLVNKEIEVDASKKDYIDLLERKLEKAVVPDEHEAYHLYCMYAHAKGFSVRKGKGEYFSGTSKLRSKLFTCSKQGFKDVESNDKGECSYARSTERTGCYARIWFKRDKDGQFKVSKWVKEHNHKMAEPDDVHMLRSARSIGPIKGNLIESHLNAGIRPIDSYNMVVEDCGGVQNVGYTEKDLYNFVSLLKSTRIEAGDSQSVINHFKKKSNEEGLFYWDVQLDVEGRVANIFWRDSRARIDYEFFGDVVTFDTTYRTNKYRLICAPFVGVNHHRKNVIFGCGFLSDETSTSFKWLFETFLESMGGKQPGALFTDQDAAMLSVVQDVFPDSKHRLCQWHISQNAPSHLAHLQSIPGFMNLWYKCLKECDSEEEFEMTWKTMMTTYNADGNSWLKRMYELRHKWSTAFNTNIFYAGLQSTSRSESTNRALNRIADRTTGLFKFVGSFENLVVGKWRRKERDHDHLSNQKEPPLIIECSEMLKYAAKKYTRRMYKMFEIEYKIGVGASDLLSEIQVARNVYSYEIGTQGKARVGRVLFDVNSMDIKCSCCKFETWGILCSHALKVLSLKNIHVIPEKYLLKRWCKDAKDRVNHSCETQSEFSVASESEMVYSNRLMRIVHDIVMDSKVDPDGRKVVEKAIENLSENWKAYTRRRDTSVQASKETFSVIEDIRDANDGPVLDPLYVKPKGVSNTRIPSHWDRQRKRLQRNAENTSSKKRTKKVVASKDVSVPTPTALQDISNLILFPSSYPTPSHESRIPPLESHGINVPFASNHSFGDILGGGQFFLGKLFAAVVEKNE